MAVRAVVLAAGAGTRMKSDLPKVLHEVAGVPLLEWVLAALAATATEETVVVIGHGSDAVGEALPAGVSTCIQEEQLGTGHAVMAALECMGEVAGDTILVVPGDMPLLSGRVLDALLAEHHSSGAAVTMLTAEVSGSDFGRILRDEQGRITGIVEQRDATAEQLAITEVNGGVYAFDGALLAESLRQIGRDNVQGEYYLTDVIGILASRGVAAMAADPVELTGVNSHHQLAAAASLMRHRIAEHWMAEGVWMLDPDRTYIGARVKLAAGVRLYPDVHLEGSTEVGPDTIVGPDVYAVDSVVGSGCRVWYAVLRDARVGDGAQVGPYASLRPETVLEADAKVGTFVETKNTRVGAGAKVPHLSYMGDADIGARSNIGAGTITCNYDGVRKHHTTIGEGAFIGSDTMLVAPVTIGNEAYTGAGSVITEDVPAGALAVERSTQKEIPGYAARVEGRRQKQVE